jgi:acetylornithine deacetylase
MDAAIFAQAGIPTVDYGPSGAGAHETVEWVSIGSVATTAASLAAAARLCCRAATHVSSENRT